MSNFKFKQFELKQERSAMKIGTDSVLLGCLCEADHAKHVLDIGSGTGILALMMAQRSAALIDAVEIDEAAATEATENIALSPWAERITLHHQSILEYAEGCLRRYDCIITNPPYYQTGKSHQITSKTRTVARHTSSLGFADLARVFVKLLSPHGKAWLILPVPEAQVFSEEAAAAGLHLQHTVHIQPTPNKLVNRLVMVWGLVPAKPTQQQLVVYENNGQPTEQYKQLANDFYTGKQFA